MSQLIGSMYRYFPSAYSQEHYTATITRNGVLEVKPGFKTFPTLEEWCVSLPGTPTVEQLKCTLSQYGTRKIHSVKEGWKVPKVGKGKHTIQNWSIHIYDMISQASQELLNREDVRDAYNHLVEVLEKYHEEIGAMRLGDYGHGAIQLGPPSRLRLPYDALHVKGSWIVHNGIYRIETHVSYTDIADTYCVLYNLIKDIVVPFTESKKYIKQAMNNLKYYNRQMGVFQRREKKLQQKLEMVHQGMKVTQSKIENMKKILEKAQ